MLFKKEMKNRRKREIISSLEQLNIGLKEIKAPVKAGVEWEQGQ